jgi:hypothetical protein
MATAGAVPTFAVLVKFRFLKVMPLVAPEATFKTPILLVLLNATILTWFCATELAVGPTTVTVWVPAMEIVSE